METRNGYRILENVHFEDQTENRRIARQAVRIGCKQN
jgi:hypothetical protein